MSFKIASKEAFKKGILQGEAGPAGADHDAAGHRARNLHRRRDERPEHQAGARQRHEPRRQRLDDDRGGAPAAEVQRYATDLRSITQGRGSFTTDFSHYQPVPAHLADQIRSRPSSTKPRTTSTRRSRSGGAGGTGQTGRCQTIANNLV